LGGVDEENSLMFISQHWIPNQNPRVEISVQRFCFWQASQLLPICQVTHLESTQNGIGKI